MIGVRLDGRCIVPTGKPPRPPHQQYAESKQSEERTMHCHRVLLIGKQACVVHKI